MVITTLVDSARERFRLTPRDRVLQVVSLSFDAHIEEVFGALTSGGTLVLRTDAMIGALEALVKQTTALASQNNPLPAAEKREVIEKLSNALGNGVCNGCVVMQLIRRLFD